MVSTDSPGELPYKVDDPGQYRADLSDMAIPIKPGVEPKPSSRTVSMKFYDMFSLNSLHRLVDLFEA